MALFSTGLEKLYEAAGIDKDKTFVTPDTTLEVTDKSGNKTYVKQKDLTDEQKKVFETRGAGATGGTNAYSLPDLTDEAKQLRAAWSTPPKITIDKGVFSLSGTKEFLQSSEAKQLRKTLKGMEGQTYNNEDLNKQIEAWNAVLSQMSTEYMDAIASMNATNKWIEDSSTLPQHHSFSLQDMQKVSNSAAIGKKPDARTTKDKIFIGFDWDDKGNAVEKWVSAADFFNEFNSMSDDKKRLEYHTLATQAREGDVGAYSKLMYLQGDTSDRPAAQAVKPANVDIDAVDDFFKTVGEHTLSALADAANFVTTYVPVFNIPRLTARGVTAAQEGDFNSFFKSDDVQKMIDAYNETVAWEDAYFSELTPASTGLAAGTGNLIGGALGMAYSIWAGGIGNTAAAAAVSQGIQRANNALFATGKFTEFTSPVTGFGKAASGLPSGLGDTMVASAGVRARVLLPTSLVKRWPGVASAIATAALNTMEYAGIGEGVAGIAKEGSLLRGAGVDVVPGYGGTMADVLSTGDRVVTATNRSVAIPMDTSSMQQGTKTLSNGVKMTVVDGGVVVQQMSLRGFNVADIASKRMISSGLQTAMRLAPLAGESALRNTDRYLQGVNAGKDMGDMSDYIVKNTARDVALGGAFLGAGAVIRGIKGVSAASRVSPVRSAEEAFDLGDMASWFTDGHFTYDTGSSYIESGLERTQDFMDFVSTIRTANGESIFVSTYTPEGGVPEVSAVPGNVAGEAGQALGFATSDIITKFEVQPIAGGANLIQTNTNIKTGETTEIRRFFTDIDEATKEARVSSVPKTSPKTIANSDLLNGVKVAPLAIDGKTPDVMPEGVSQVRVEPGIVYRTPDGVVDELMTIAENSGWSAESQDRLQTEYQQYIEEARAAQDDAVRAQEIIDIPKQMDGTDIEMLLRTAAWAKVKGFSLIPFKSAPVTSVSRTYKKFSMQDRFISKLADKYELPELNPASIIANSRTEFNEEYWNNNPNGTLQLVLPRDIGSVPTGNLADYASQEQLNMVDFFGVLDLLAENELYHGGALTNKNEAARLQNLREIGRKVADSHAARAIQLARVFWGVEKDELLKAVDNYVNRTVDNMNTYVSWDPKSGPENARKLMKELLHDAVERGYDGFVDLTAPVDDKAIKDYFRDVFNTDRALATAVKNGTPIQSDIVVPVRKAGDILVYSEGKVYLDWMAEDMGNTPNLEGIFKAHIPAGTKVVRAPSHGSNGVTIRIRDGFANDWAFDASAGITESNGEIYVNKSNGAPHKPKKTEYNLADYSVYDMAADGMTGTGLRKIANELLTPNKPVIDANVAQRKDRASGNRNRKTIYEVTEPGGPVNRINYFLRKQIVQGEIPKDSISTRVGLLNDIIDRAFQEGDRYYNEDLWWDTTPAPLDAMRIDQLISSFYNLLLGDGVSSDDVLVDGLDNASNIMVQGSGLGEILSKANKKRSFLESKNSWKMGNEFLAKWMENNGLTKEYVDKHTKVDDYVSDANDIIHSLELMAPDLAKMSMSEQQAALDKIRARFVDLVLKYNDSPEFPKNYSIWMEPLTNGLAEEGSHKVKTNMLWDLRGANESGNDINSADGIRMHIKDLKVGDHVVWPSLDFASFNLATPNRYARSNKTDDEKYLILTGSPKGTGIFFFGDPENFGGYDNDNHIHLRDGGASVHPLNMGATIVSIREIGPKTKLIIQIRDNADGTPYSGEIDGQNRYTQAGGRIQVQTGEETVTREFPNNFLVTQYGAPYAYFPDADSALEFADRMGERAVYDVSRDADTLDRPPVTTEDIKQEPLMLTAGGDASPYIARFNDLMISLPTLSDSPIDYTRAVVDIVDQVQAIFQQVSLNVNLDNLYENYGRALAEGKEPTALPSEKEALKPLTQVLDALGHYFDPSGKSLTQEFYLPTGAAAKKKINIKDALLGKDGSIDEDDPVDGGLDDILMDPLRVGNSGFWQKRTGDLFRDADGNFTMSKAGSLEENLIAYTVSSLTRGKNKLAVAVNNEVARSKFDKNRSQITAKQAYAGLKDADTIRTKARSIQAKISGDADALAELKENYSGDESTIDKALEEKNYANELNYTNALNTTAQKLGYNQFLKMNNIPGSALRFGGNATNFRGTSNIRRKMEKINVTGTMWVERFGEKVNVGFGLDPIDSNFKIYGHFKPEKAVNLGQLINLHFDAERAAIVFMNQIAENLKNWAGGDGWDLMGAISEFARENFPLVADYEWYTAQLMKKIGQNYNKYTDSEEAYIANIEEISKWIRRASLECFNNAIKMSDISGLDNRTINALDEAAAYMLIGTPVKRSKAINAAQELAVWSALGLNPRVAIGNLFNEPLRLIDTVGYKGFAKAWKTALNPKEALRINNILSDLPSRFDNPEMVGLAEKAKSTFGKLKDKASNVALSPLEKSEQFKNILFWAAAEQNAAAKYPGDKSKQLQETLRFFNDYAIAGGKGTVPGVATASFGRTLNIFKTFTLRNFDDFIDYVEKVSRGESGNNYWDEKYEKRHKTGAKDKSGRNKVDPRIAVRVVGGRVLRSWLFWILVGSYFGKSFIDSLGGDPSGITEGGYDRGIYDDPDTDEYEGMTGLDDFVNSLPAGFILGALQDLYFAARRRGIESGQFLGFDVANDPRFVKSMESKLPLGVAKNRFADMLDLLDRGYSFSSTGRKTYAAPETALDVAKGFLFGKATTQNSLAYGKYRYGNVDFWGDLSSGDWMDFAMNSTLGAVGLSRAQFDTNREDYTGVFNGSWNDIQTMQLIIQSFRTRQQQIINDFQANKYRYTGDYKGLTDEEKVAKAKEIRDKAIDDYTDDVVRAVDAFEKAGNALSDSQITTMMYLFDFHEGEEDDEWNSSYARKRYVEAGLPDYDAAGIKRVESTTNGKTKESTQNILDRSLLIKNAQQGFYGSSKEAANAVKAALSDFKSTYKEYNTRVKALNNKYFDARKKNKYSAETKQLSQNLEKLQNEYLDKLYAKLSPVVEKYGTALIGTYDVADALEEYMGNMIPYSSIKKYGQTYSSGNDIVYGQLTEWLQKRWGRSAPTAPSDKEVTNGISEIKKLLDQGKTASAKSKARAILEKIGRGSLGARRQDVETLRDYAYD